MVELNRAYRRGPASRCAAATASFWKRKNAFLRRQADLPGVARNRVRGELEWLSRKAQGPHPQGAGAHRRGAATQGELADLDRAHAARRVLASTSPRTERKTKRLLVEGITSTLSIGGRTLVRGSRPRPLAGHAARPPRPERQRQDHAAAAALARPRRPTRATVRPPTRLQVVMFDQHRSSSIPR